MNKETLAGDWNMLKGKIKEKWGRLTDDDLTEIKGKRDQLLGKIQKRYGLAKEKAEQELSEWERTFQFTGGAARQQQSGTSRQQEGGSSRYQDKGESEQRHSSKNTTKY